MIYTTIPFSLLLPSLMCFAALGTRHLPAKRLTREALAICSAGYGFHRDIVVDAWGRKWSIWPASRASEFCNHSRYTLRTYSFYVHLYVKVGYGNRLGDMVPYISNINHGDSSLIFNDGFAFQRAYVRYYAWKSVHNGCVTLNSCLLWVTAIAFFTSMLQCWKTCSAAWEKERACSICSAGCSPIECWRLSNVQKSPLPS